MARALSPVRQHALLYLDRYPNGTFAEIARSRASGQSSVDKPADDPSVALAFWETVKDSGNKEMIEAYLRK